MPTAPAPTAVLVLGDGFGEDAEPRDMAERDLLDASLVDLHRAGSLAGSDLVGDGEDGVEAVTVGDGEVSVYLLRIEGGFASLDFEET